MKRGSAALADRTRGSSESELALKLGVKQSTVAKWERKGAAYREKTRKKFSKVFGLGEKYFIY